MNIIYFVCFFVNSRIVGMVADGWCVCRRLAAHFDAGNCMESNRDIGSLIFMIKPKLAFESPASPPEISREQTLRTLRTLRIWILYIYYEVVERRLVSTLLSRGSKNIGHDAEWRVTRASSLRITLSQYPFPFLHNQISFEIIQC